MSDMRRNVVGRAGLFLRVLARDPALLERRLRSREKEKPQRLIQLVGLVTVMVPFVLPGIDHRFGWSHVPPWLVAVSTVLMIYFPGSLVRELPGYDEYRARVRWRLLPGVW